MAFIFVISEFPRTSLVINRDFTIYILFSVYVTQSQQQPHSHKRDLFYCKIVGIYRHVLIFNFNFCFCRKVYGSLLLSENKTKYKFSEV